MPNNLIFADVSGDGNYRLVLTDISTEGESSVRLKVYKGTLLCSDQPLPDISSSLISFYADNFDPKLPGKSTDLDNNDVISILTSLIQVSCHYWWVLLVITQVVITYYDYCLHYLFCRLRPSHLNLHFSLHCHT